MNKKPKQTITAISLTPWLLQALDDLAWKAKKTRSAYLRSLIKKELRVKLDDGYN